MRMSNKQVYGRSVKKGMPVGEPRTVELKEPRKNVPNTSVSDEIAGQSWHYKNQLVTEFKKQWPNQPRMWHCDKYYPQAAKGALWVDEPTTAIEKENSLKKQEIAKANGMRFLIAGDGVGVEDALIQLGDI